MILLFAIYSFLVNLVFTAGVSPTWTLTNSIKTGTSFLFTSLTPAGTTNSYTIDFPSQFATSVTPFVVYGIQRYRASDFLIQESFILTMTSEDFIGFILQLQITGITNPVLMCISFMAVDPSTFTYYFNAFTEVPLNYASSLTNFSTASTSLLTHLEVVDYADQTANYPTLGPTSTYTTFSTPYSKYRIALFLTSIAITSTSTIPVSFDVTCSVLSSTTYSMYATLGYNSTITLLQFSQVFFDTSQFSVNSNKYLYFQEWSVTDTTVTSFFPFNSILTTNFMMGIKSFSAISGQCTFQYQWYLTSVSGNFGAQLQISSPYTGVCGLSADVSTILFMMNWACSTPGYPLFDLASQLCLNTCNPYTYMNSTDSTCYPCVNTVCYTCNVNDSSICLTCATNQVVVNNTCICDTSQGYYLLINGTCYKCSDLQSYCSLCSYSADTSLALNVSAFMCLTCNSTQGYFLDPNNLCKPCSVSNCATCLGYTSCAVCNAGYGVTASGTCSTCPISGCQTCINLTACSICATGYNMINNLCYTCPTSCTCGGYALPKYSNGDCSTVCGDGIIIFPYEGCDDKNIKNGDGCSSTCQVEPLSSCSGAPSVCYFTSTITGSLVNSQVSASSCNVITFNFILNPYLILQTNTSINWFNAIASQNTSILYSQIQYQYSNGVISLTYAYNTDLQGKNVIFKINPQSMNSATYLYYTASSTLNVVVIPSNNIPAVYLGNDRCSKIASTQAFMQAQAGIGYLGLLLSIFSCKIIGLEMFGVLQLSYFSLSNYDYVPAALMGLLQRKEVNGLNIQPSSARDNNIPSRVSTNGYTQSDYLSNINIMLLVTALIAISGMIMYMVTYLINKDYIDQQKNLSQALKSVDNDNHQSRDEAKEEESRSQFWHKKSKYILKEILLTFVIFNMFNISYSAGIQIKYISDVNSFSIICLLLTFTLIVLITGAQVVTDKVEFGEYIDKFKKEKMQSRYMIATIIYRFVLGFLLALINEWIASGIVFTFISGAFLTYICYFEPFTDNFQNIRSKFIHSVHVLILFINFYYRMQANGNPTEASNIAVPAYIQIVAVAISVFGSTILLGYELIQKYILKKKTHEVEGPAEAQEYIQKVNLERDVTISKFLE